MGIRSRTTILALVVVALLGWTPLGHDLPAGDPSDDPGPTDALSDAPEYDDLGIAHASHAATSCDVRALIDSCGVYDPSVNYNDVIDGHGTGLAPPDVGTYADLVGNVNVVTDLMLAPGAKLAPAVDHSAEPYFPIVDSQGGQGSCAAWACSYYTNGYLQAKDNGWTDACNGTNTSQLMSPAWVYNKINYGYDSGSNWYRNCDLMATVGNCDWAHQPYDWRDLYGWGDEAAFRNAPRYRIQYTYDMTAASNTMVIKSWIAQGYVCPIALNAYEYSPGLASGDPVLSSAEYEGGAANHANTIVGYNDSITDDGDAGAFLVVNSWGQSWGSAWGGYGYYWMTYDAVAELYYPVLRMYDRVDYEPELLATMNQSVPGSKSQSIHVGTDSGLYSYRYPQWTAGTKVSPPFIALDVTELVEEVGLSGFYLTVGSASPSATIASFEVEHYPDGYDEGNPSETATSSDTPRTAPCTIHASFADRHINQTAPAAGSVHRGEVTLNGTATRTIPCSVLVDDFEGRWSYLWTTSDANSTGGADTWGESAYRVNGGDKSLWCAGEDGGVVSFTDFNDAGSLDAGWSRASPGEDTHPWSMVNSGYGGAHGSDYVAVARSNWGAGTNVTERLYTSTPLNASCFDNLSLSLYLELDHSGGDDHLRVMCANGSAYPAYTTLVNYTQDSFGYRTLDLSSMDGEDAVYLCFEYHGTDDMYAVIDDVLVSGERSVYDQGMDASVYRSTGDLGAFSEVTLAYSYWVDSEARKDQLEVVCRNTTGGCWTSLEAHSGADKTWRQNTVEVPTDAVQVGFRFTSDGANQSEGAYVDDVELVGHYGISGVDVRADGGAWKAAKAGANWSFDWDTSDLDDGAHELTARVNYSGRFNSIDFKLLSDNTPPTVLSVWNDTTTTGEATMLHVTAEDANGVGEVTLHYAFNGLPSPVLGATTLDNVTWNVTLEAPLDAAELVFMFTVNDTLGNSADSGELRVRVIDNDDPGFASDLTPALATTGDPLTFGIDAVDNIGVDHITLSWWYAGRKEEAENVTLSGPSFHHTVDVPHALGTIVYSFLAEDSSGNNLTTPDQTIPVMDNDLPVFASVDAPEEASTGSAVDVVVEASDNIALDGCFLNYRWGDGARTNLTMTDAGTGTGGASLFKATVQVPIDSIEPLGFSCLLVDSSGNWASIGPRVVTVIDDVLPRLGPDVTSTNATTGDIFTFAVNATDNIAVDEVWVEWWYGQEPHQEGTMVHSLGARYMLNVVAKHTQLDMAYVLHTRDTSGNVNSTPPATVEVLDDDLPELLWDHTPSSTTTGSAFTVSLDVADNIAVASATLTYWYDGGEAMEVALEGQEITGQGNGTYAHTLAVPDDSTDPLIYAFSVEDEAGNSNASTPRLVEVLDVEAPLVLAGEDVVIDQHQTVTIDGSGSSDNVGIANWTWTFVYGSATVVEHTPSFEYTFHAAGHYRVKLTVVDPSGNAALGTMNVTVNDITAPEAASDPTPEVDQGDRYTFDGTSSTDNVGVTDWTWSFVYGGTQRELHGERAAFDFIEPGSYDVTLTVEDAAGNQDTAQVNVKVWDTVTPVALTQGDMEAKKGEGCTFDASSSMDNVGIVNWTWEVEYDSGKLDVAYGEVVDYTFDEPGDHRVTLTVTDADGNQNVAEDFTVHVPNVLLWVLLVLVLAGAAGGGVLAARRRRRSD